MAKRKVWLTALGEAGPQANTFVQTLGKVGLDVVGAKWNDDAQQFPWSVLGVELSTGEKTDAWVIVVTSAALTSKPDRYALSLAAAVAEDLRGAPLPIFVVGLTTAPKAEELPPGLRSAVLLSARESSWGAKVVAGLARPRGVSKQDYRFSALGFPGLGQWYEVGPRNETWQGAMFGVPAGVDITHHGVGLRSHLPERCVLNYPIAGMSVEIRGTPYTAWAVQNPISSEESYFIRVIGMPENVFFGGHPGTDQSEVNVITLI